MSEPAPTGTYRLQLRPEFGFDEAAAVLPYLHDLGVTHCYASPYLKARPGSNHGYDTQDYTKIDPYLGNLDHFAKLEQEAAK